MMKTRGQLPATLSSGGDMTQLYQCVNRQTPQFAAQTPSIVSVVGELTRQHGLQTVPFRSNRYVRVLGDVNSTLPYRLKLVHVDPNHEDKVYTTAAEMDLQRGRIPWTNSVVICYFAFVDFLHTLDSLPNPESKSSQKEALKRVGEIIRFQSGKLPTSEVNLIHNSKIPPGLTLMVSSDIPENAHMGSQLSLVISVVHCLMMAIVGHNPELEYLQNSDTIEKCLPEVALKMCYLSKAITIGSEPENLRLGDITDDTWVTEDPQFGFTDLLLGMTSHVDQGEVSLPETLRFIIADTGHRADKSVNMKQHNKRLFETRIAAMLLYMAVVCEAKLHLDESIWDADRFITRAEKDYERFTRVSVWPRLHLLNSHMKALGVKIPLSRLAYRYLKPIYTREDLLEIFDREKLQLLCKLIGDDCLFERESTFTLQQSVIHIIQEGQRARIFSHNCYRQYQMGEMDEQLKALGHLIDACHGSARDLLGISNGLIEDVRDVAKRFAALGSRARGPYVFIACHSDAVPRIMDGLVRHYYKKTIQSQLDRKVNTSFSRGLEDKVKSRQPLHSSDLHCYLFEVDRGSSATWGRLDL